MEIEKKKKTTFFKEQKIKMNNFASKIDLVCSLQTDPLEPIELCVKENYI